VEKQSASLILFTSYAEKAYSRRNPAAVWSIRF